MESLADNSFFHNGYHNSSVLIFVPHEDDEILTAGPLINVLLKLGATINIVFATNGDFKYPAKTRISEAIKSADILGVSENQIIFMGYGDSAPTYYSKHIFFHENDKVESLAGYSCTYGAPGHQDYAFCRRNAHNDYTSNNYLGDIIEIIEVLHPDLIICSDLDEHPDHKMLSVSFDKAIGIIKHKQPEYSPEVLKTFAYSLYYSAPSDFSSFNNPETQKPVLGITDKYSYDIIDRFNYSWDDRIRFPISIEQRCGILSKNIISKALKAHSSQGIITRADRVINSDGVFFRRRTDNLAYQAEISVTSGNADYLVDFMLYNINSVIPNSLSLSDYYWQPDENDNKKRILFKWQDPIVVEEIVLYGTYSEESSIDKLLIKLSDGYTIETTELQNNGAPLHINVGHHTSIEWCEISVISWHGKEYGISECEFFSNSKHESNISPFCKITIDDNFVYDYVCSENVKTINLGLYYYGCTGKIEKEVIKGKSKIIGDILYIDNEDKTIVIRASNHSGDVYDQISVYRCSKAELRSLERVDKRNNRFISLEKKRLKVHNAFFILKNNGIFFVLRRTWDNIIKPRLVRKNDE